MAKSKSIFSTLSGSIGSVTFRHHTTANGSSTNVVSSKATTVKNPRTAGQCVQRARFATAVKFYKRAVKNFFQFAYEDKRANESYYNAFMRHNIMSALPMNHFQINSEAYPAIGDKWLLTQGQLLPIRYAFTGANAVRLGVNAATTETNLTTVGELSSLLITQGYQSGDIFTMVVVASSITKAAFNAATREEVVTQTASVSDVPQWYIAQFIINPNSELNLTEMNFRGPSGMIASYTPIPAGVTITLAEGYTLLAFAAIITRNVSDNKLLASTQYMEYNAAMSEIISLIHGATYTSGMYTSWQVDDNTPILKGSVAGGSSEDSTEVVARISKVNGSAIPATISTQESKITLQLAGTGLTALDLSSFAATSGTFSDLKITSKTAASVVITVPSGSAMSTVSCNSVEIANLEIGRV